MQKLLILLSIFATAYAGVGVVTPEIEAEALRLWQKHCEGLSEGGSDDNLVIYCKKSRDNIEENLVHNVELNPSGPVQDQIVFVQPPSYNYLHDVVVTGGGGSAPKTIIYVKPPKNTNEVNIVDQTVPAGKPEKPVTYFLKGNHGEEANVRSRRHNIASAEVGNDAGPSASEVSEVAVAAPQNLQSEGEAPKRSPVIYILRRRV